MSLALLREVQRHRTADEFVREFLIPKMKEGEFLERAAPPVAGASKHGSTVPHVLFANERDRNGRLPFEVAQTRASVEGIGEGHAFSSSPHLSIGTFSRVFLHPDDFARATDFYGKDVYTHSHHGASDTHVLRLPTAAFSHWQPRLVSTHGHSNTLLVTLSEPVFRELQAALRLGTFVNRYLSVVSFFKGEKGYTREHLAAHLKIRPEESKQRDPIAAFLEAHASEVDLIQRFSTVNTIIGIRKLLSDKFEPSKRVDHYAISISKVLRQGSGVHASQRLAVTPAVSRTYVPKR